MALSARGPREHERRAGEITPTGTVTPRANSSLKMAGLDLSNMSSSSKPPMAPQSARESASRFSGRRGVDTVPMVRESGKKGEVDPWSCVPEIIQPTPRTPESRPDILNRHKKRSGPGEISVHWGMKSLSIPEPGAGYGVKSDKNENAADVFKAGQKYGIEEYVQSRGESIYQSVKMEPLGASWLRGHVIPEETKKRDFRGFGKAGVPDEFGAKESIFPRGVGAEQEEDKERYKKTHGAFDPGEPMNRNYVWPEKVKNNAHFMFGTTESTTGNNNSAGAGAKTALTMDLEKDGTFPRTRVVNRTSEDYRQVANDKLSIGRNMMQGRPPVPAGHCFGVKSGSDSEHAGDLMRGFYTPAEQKPDQDLGKCTVKGRRNFHTKRPFGVASVRHDLLAPPQHKRSIASSTNYGDDHSAFSLIYPEKFGFRGVADGDFFVRRRPEEMRSVLEGAGYKLEDQDFRMLWEDAVQAFGDDQQLVSMEVMLNILGHWMSVTGFKPQNSPPLIGAEGTLLPPAMSSQ